MAALFDTSVFIAAMIATHPDHEASAKLLERVHAKSLQGYLSLHSVAECYSVLTAYPMQPRILPQIAKQLVVHNILKHFECIPLIQKDYAAAMERVCILNLKSGAIYDALILQSALKKKIKTIYTWNVDEFSKLAQGEIQIQKPELVKGN